MQIRYRNTMKHLVALQKYVMRRTTTGKTMMLHRFLMVEAIILFITIVFAINHNPLKVFLGFVVATSLAWLFRERAVVMQFRRDFKRERKKDETGLFDKDRVLSIAPDGLTVEMGSQRNEYTWDEVDLTGRDRKHVYVILTGVLHYVIPVSAFSDDDQIQTFLDSIDSFRKTASE